MASILLAAVAGSPSSQHLPGREPPCYLEDVKARGKFSLGECKKLFLNFTTADDVPALVALDLRGNVALEGCSEAVAKALLDTRKSRKPAVEELWFPINDQQEGSGAVDLVQQLEYAEVMGHDEL